MITGIQVVGVFFAFVMLYLTFLYYKKSSYSTRSFILWSVVWLGFLAATFFPQTLYNVMEELSIQRTVDFFVIGGFMFFTIIIFYLFTIVKELEKKIEIVVRRTAVNKPKKK